MRQPHLKNHINQINHSSDTQPTNEFVGYVLVRTLLQSLHFRCATPARCATSTDKKKLPIWTASSVSNTHPIQGLKS
jgi:hypothetical protein